MHRPIVGLLSDFGLKDPYVAEMKAVILSICEDAQIIDISHAVSKFSVRMGAFVLASAVPYFPKGALYVAVIDPGVGTERRPILVETKRSLFIGPDNGLLMLAARQEGIKHVYSISNTRLMLRKVSGTFHGRDIFAPVTAYLAKGKCPSFVGPEIEDFVVPRCVKPAMEDGVLIGEVLHVDDFGNVITNISEEDFKRIETEQGDSLVVRVEQKALKLGFCSAYGDAPRNQLLTLIGSHGFLEIAMNQGGAAERLSAREGMNVRISKV